MDAPTIGIFGALLSLFALIVGAIVTTSAKGTHAVVSEGMKTFKESTDKRAETMQASINFNSEEVDRLRKRVVSIEEENATLKTLVLDRDVKIAELKLRATANETAAELREKNVNALTAQVMLLTAKVTAVETMSSAKDDVIAGLSTKLDTANRQLELANQQMTRIIHQNDIAAKPEDRTEADAAHAHNTIMDAHAADPMHDPSQQPDVTNMLGQFNMTATIKDAVLTPTNASEMLVGSADLPDAQRGITPPREGSAL